MMMNMTMLQERKGRKEGGGAGNGNGNDSSGDEDLASRGREGERRRLSHDQERQQKAQRETRWLLFLSALKFLGQVLFELGRRALRVIERAVPRYIAFVDRLLVQTVRGSTGGGGSSGGGGMSKRWQRPARLTLLLLLVLSVPYLMYRMQRAQYGNSVSILERELNEEKIRPQIIVDRQDTPQETKRRAFLRAGGDRLQTDDTTQSCENTVQGVDLLADSMGYVCNRSQQDKTKPGCCNESDTTLPRIKQFSCDKCDTNPPHCCEVFEHCVSCCMHPLNENIRREYLTHADASHPVYGDPSALTVFQYCKFRCRTSSASVQHQNSYRSHRTFCYGIHRPLKVLPTVNSDGLHDEWSESALEGARDKLLPDAQLELDSFYVDE